MMNENVLYLWNESNPNRIGKSFIWINLINVGQTYNHYVSFISSCISVRKKKEKTTKSHHFLSFCINRRLMKWNLKKKNWKTTCGHVVAKTKFNSFIRLYSRCYPKFSINYNNLHDDKAHVITHSIQLNRHISTWFTKIIIIKKKISIII